MINDEAIEDFDELSEIGDDAESLFERLSLTVDKGQEPLRIDKFLQQRLEKASRNKLHQAIEKGQVLVNNQPIKPNYKVKPGDLLLVLSEKSPETFEVKPEQIPLTIVYEDNSIIIINKNPGMVVHPGCGNYQGTLLNGIAWHLQSQQPDIDEKLLPRFGMVHRIDKNTSGLLVLAKTEKASKDLSHQFFEHTVSRKYVALVWGNLENDEGTITGNVGRHQRFRKIMDVYSDGEYGKEAVTHYTVLERFRYVTLVECRLETGRTHQIRVHMQHKGHPLFNDETYGGDKILKGTIFTKYKQFVENCFEICPRQALHAQTLGFTHPETGERVFFNSPIPNDMQQVLDKWRKYTTNN
jgi:23S rRNA pseudouridine1911/1915/1917 synthase